MECKKCNIDRDLDRFRQRTKNGYIYLQHTCIDCENLAQKKRYSKNKDCEEFKVLNRKRVKIYRDQNKELVSLKSKAKRQTVSYKKNRIRYIAENKEKIKAQESVCKKKYYLKNKDEISDVYVRNKVMSVYKLKKETVLSVPYLIENHRMQIKLNRLIKNKKS